MTPELMLIQNGPYHLQVACQGEGPLVIFCHGFPGLWRSWRHQLNAVATAGYTAVALDMRGYGGSSKPGEIAEYRLSCIRSDLKAVMAHFGEASAVFVGSDFGAAVVWSMAVAEPDCVRALVVLSVPYDHDYYGNFGQSEDLPLPSQRFAAAAEGGFLHAHYFQAPGIAEQELDAQPSEFLTRLFWALSGKGNLLERMGSGKPGMGYMDVLGPAAEALPWEWMSNADLDAYAQAFSEGGFRGALNWYRVCDQSWEENRAYRGRVIDQPCLFIAGKQDPVIVMSGEAALNFMASKVANLQDVLLVDKAGHFVQMEQAQAVSQAICGFLSKL